MVRAYVASTADACRLSAVRPILSKVNRERTQVLRLTYVNLRWLLVLLPAVLFVVTVGAAIHQGYLEASISAYYGGPVRDVFVGVLLAVAVLLLAHQGATSFENYNLNGAGFYAVFVALIPAGLSDIFAELRSGAGLSARGISPAEYAWSLRISLTVVVVLALTLLVLELRSTERMRALVTGDRIALVFVLVTAATLLAFLALAMWQLWVPPAGEITMEGLTLSALPLLGDVQVAIHDLAAIFLLSALAATVWSHAWPVAAARRSRESVQPGDLEHLAGYRVIFVLMLLGPVIAWGISRAFAPGHLVIFLEWWEIALFCTFWVLETRRQARGGGGAWSAASSSTKTSAPEATRASISSSDIAASSSSERST